MKDKIYLQQIDIRWKARSFLYIFSQSEKQ